MKVGKYMKLAILSGTFDPIHNSHISLIEFVHKNFSYDKILIIPAYNPPFKNNSIEPQHRLKMTQIATKKKLYAEVSDIEFQSTEKSYSYITLKKLYDLYKPTDKIGFIIGTDAYINLPKWYKAEELKALANFIVFEREYLYSDEKVKNTEELGFNMIKAPLPFLNISSSEIRNLIKENKNFSQFVSKEVEEYIKKHELYK